MCRCTKPVSQSSYKTRRFQRATCVPLSTESPPSFSPLTPSFNPLSYFHPSHGAFHPPPPFPAHPFLLDSPGSLFTHRHPAIFYTGPWSNPPLIYLTLDTLFYYFTFYLISRFPQLSTLHIVVPVEYHSIIIKEKELRLKYYYFFFFTQLVLICRVSVFLYFLYREITVG